MGKLPTKARENIYCKARILAAEKNPLLNSRERAAEELGISKDSLADYELGLSRVPVDKVVRMADIYKAPELLNNYCCNECPIGKINMMPIDNENIKNVYKFAIAITNELERSEAVQKIILKILEDGDIDESERTSAVYAANFLKSIATHASEFQIIIEKCLEKMEP